MKWAWEAAVILIRYPLVNIHTAAERSTVLNGKTHDIFNSDFKLPEGILGIRISQWEIPTNHENGENWMASSGRAAQNLAVVASFEETSRKRGTMLPNPQEQQTVLGDFLQFGSVWFEIIKCCKCGMTDLSGQHTSTYLENPFRRRPAAICCSRLLEVARGSRHDSLWTWKLGHLLPLADQGFNPPQGLDLGPTLGCGLWGLVLPARWGRGRDRADRCGHVAGSLWLLYLLAGLYGGLPEQPGLVQILGGRHPATADPRGMVQRHQ